MNTLENYLNALETTISKQAAHHTGISNVNVGWHIEHILLTINAIIDQLQKSTPENYKWKFKIARLLVFSLNKIPRGKAQSPQVVVPQVYSEQSLFNHLTETQRKLQTLESLDANKYFNHPFFGNLKKGQTIKFLQIHTKHNLSIINDIIAS
ncbi:MAG: hypothetical protein RL660_1727 [Bacteroidota bacterium]